MSVVIVANDVSNEKISNEKTLNQMKLIQDLRDVGCFKTGTFVLKSGQTSNFYIDLRTLITYPKLLHEVAKCIAQKIKSILFNSNTSNKKYVVCGLAYGAIPLATLVSNMLDVSMIFVRKEAKKTHGATPGKLIVGTFHEGQECIIIDDVITSGSTIYETIEIIEKETSLNGSCKLPVSCAFVFIDRRSFNNTTNATNATNETKYPIQIPIHCVLNYHSLISSVDSINDYQTQLNQTQLNQTQLNQKPKQKISFNDRIEKTSNAQTKTLFEIMCLKKSNLIVSIDIYTDGISNIDDIIAMTDAVGPYVCAVKYHCDTWTFPSYNNRQVNDIYMMYLELRKLALKHRFLIIEDRKFADIGATVQQQCRHIGSPDFVTVLPVAGPGTITAISNHSASLGQIIVAELSTKDNFLKEGPYREECLKLLNGTFCNISGFVCQSRNTLLESFDFHINESKYDSFIYMTPGVHLSATKDNNDQQYRTPEDAIIRDGCDAIIVGRGITQFFHNTSCDFASIVQEYQNRAWNAYLKRSFF